MAVSFSRLLPGLCLAALLALAGCNDEAPPAPDLVRVRVLPVEPADYAATANMTGDVQARVQTDLSFRVGGKITQRKVDVGDHVGARQVLAQLDPRDLQVNVDSAQAEVTAQQARVKQTQAAFERQVKLLPKGYTSQSEYDNAQAELHSSRSALAAAQAQLADAREQLGYTALVADAPGVITARKAEVGQVVQATAPIFSLAREGERDAVFNVYESLFVDPPVDQPVTVTLLDNPAIKATGRIREVTPAVSAQSGTLQVKVALQNIPAGMPLGAVVSASLSGQMKPSVALPWAALTKDAKDPAVWLVDNDRKVSLQKVNVARYLTGQVIVSDGLQQGQRVVVAGGQLLHPGMQVEIAEEGHP